MCDFINSTYLKWKEIRRHKQAKQDTNKQEIIVYYTKTLEVNLSYTPGNQLQNILNYLDTPC